MWFSVNCVLVVLLVYVDLQIMRPPDLFKVKMLYGEYIQGGPTVGIQLHIL